MFQLDEQTDDKRSLSMTACHPLADVQEQSGIIGACSMENLACCCCIVVLMDMVPSAENMQDKGLHVWSHTGAVSWEDQYRLKICPSQKTLLPI